MSKDKLVFDIETKNTFADVGGRENVDKLSASFVGVYSYNQDKYLSFFESDFPKLNDLFKNAGLLIGFALNRFDIPVINKYLDFDIWQIPRYDILEEIEQACGLRISLEILAQTNLGLSKKGHGLDAVKYYKEQDWESLKNYCLQDVKLTKELYELAKKQGHLLVPRKFGNDLMKVPLTINEIHLPQTLI